MIEFIKSFVKKPYLYLSIILFGVALKFIGLESKFFWLDEIYTIQHTSGITTEDYFVLMPKDSLVNISYFNDLLDLNNGTHSISTQLYGLSQMPQFTPLHYVFLVFWHRIVGGDYLDYRLFGIFIFILTLPIIYLFAKSLLRSQLAGWIATSFYSVSPFLHLFAQEARYYILWAFFLVLINYLILKAIQNNNLKWWIFYALASILALYTSTFSAPILIGHLIYVLIWEKKGRFKVVICQVCVAILYFPWFLTIIINRAQIQDSISWQEGSISIWRTLIGPWYGMAQAFSQTQGFWGYFYSIFYHSLNTEMIIAYLIHGLIICLIVFSTCYLIRTQDAKIIWFILLLIIPGVLFFYFLDFSGRWISFSFRYHIVNFIGAFLIVTAFIKQKLQSGKLSVSLIYLTLIGLAIYSVFKINENPCWPGFDTCNQDIIAAEIISAEKSSLIITDFAEREGMMGLWETICECTSEDIDILYTQNPVNLKDIILNHNYSAIFLFHASSKLISNILESYKINNFATIFPKTYLLDNYINDHFAGNRDCNYENYILDETSYNKAIRNVLFKVYPKILPSSSNIFITGNHSELGDWNPAIVAMKQYNDEYWEYSCKVNDGSHLEYKITGGSWDSEFVSEDGRIMSNLILNVQSDTTITIVVENWNDLAK